MSHRDICLATCLCMLHKHLDAHFGLNASEEGTVREKVWFRADDDRPAAGEC